MDNITQHNSKSKLLLDEHPIIIIPSLAQAIGDREAYFLQQIHYWLKVNEKAGKNYKNGRYWTYNTFEQLQEQQFPWLSVRTLKRIVTSLRNKGLIITDHLNKRGYDRTTWYSIDYDVLAKIDAANNAKVTKRHDAECQDGTMKDDKMAPPIPETLPETKPESGDHSHSSSNSKNGAVNKACATWRDIFYKHKGYNPTITTPDYKALERLINQHGYDQVEILLNEYVLNANKKEANEAGYALSWLPGAANRLLKGRADRQAAEAKRQAAEAAAKTQRMNRLITDILFTGYDANKDQIDRLTPEDRDKLIEIVEFNAKLPEYQNAVSSWRDQGDGADA